MPARLLRRFSMGVFVANTWKAVGPVIPNARALVGRVVVTPTGANTVFSLGFGAADANGNRIVDSMPLAIGEQFEQAVVIPAGETINAMVTNANGVTVTVLGEEVDN